MMLASERSAETSHLTLGPLNLSPVTHLWGWISWWSFLPRYVPEERWSAPHTGSKTSLLLPSGYYFLTWISVKGKQGLIWLLSPVNQDSLIIQSWRKVPLISRLEGKKSKRDSITKQRLQAVYRDCFRAGYRLPRAISCCGSVPVLKLIEHHPAPVSPSQPRSGPVSSSQPQSVPLQCFRMICWKSHCISPFHQLVDTPDSTCYT